MKSTLVVSLWNVLRTEAFFQGYGLQIVTGSQYLRGFVGMDTVHTQWLEEKVAG